VDVVQTGRCARQTPPPSAVGQWSTVFSWPAVAVHAHLLRKRESSVLAIWFDGQRVESGRRIVHAVAEQLQRSALPGHIFLADGRLISLGGWDRSTGALGIRDVNLFDPDAQTWTPAAPMAYRRWYPNGTMLPDGRVLVVSGDQNSLNDIAARPKCTTRSAIRGRPCRRRPTRFPSTRSCSFCRTGAFFRPGVRSRHDDAGAQPVHAHLERRRRPGPRRRERRDVSAGKKS